MLLAVVLLACLFGVVVPCLVIAAHRGVWLRVDIEQRIEVSSTTTIRQHYEGPASAAPPRRASGLAGPRRRVELPLLRPDPRVCSPTRKEITR